MKYAQAAPIVERLMEIAALYHASPSVLRTKLHEALEEIPHLDDACFERGCPMDDDYATSRITRLIEAERETCAKIAETAEPYQSADLIRKRGQA